MDITVYVLCVLVHVCVYEPTFIMDNTVYVLCVFVRVWVYVCTHMCMVSIHVYACVCVHVYMDCISMDTLLDNALLYFKNLYGLWSF